MGLADDIRNIRNAASAAADAIVPTPEEEAALSALGCVVSASRQESLVLAMRLGADAATLILIAEARLVARSGSIVLPGRYTTCSRATGWARRGWGPNSEWGTFDRAGWRVAVPGRWFVESSDGFSRKERAEWDVEHISVGDQTWTLAHPI